MNGRYNVAVVGASGLVGEAILALLSERDFAVETLDVVGDEGSAGGKIEHGRHQLAVRNLTEFDFSKVQIAFFATDAGVANEHARPAAEAGCVVIDSSARFRYEPDVPLVVPEVNPQALAGFRHRGIVANPGASAIHLLVALKAIYDAAGIERVDVTVCEAVSDLGNPGIEELAQQTAQLLNARPVKPGVFAKQIAFNLIPQSDEFVENGYTRGEMTLVREIQKVLGDEGLGINPTVVRVPVFFGHSIVAHVVTRTRIGAERARQLLREAPGVAVVDDHEAGRYATAVTDSAGQDAVFVGRIREDLSRPNGLNLWVVADNIRKGAALNSVQIAELLVKRYL